MTTSDPLVQAVWHAMDVCDSLAGAHVGEPVLVSDIQKVTRWPAWPIRTGDAVVDLVVLTDGVWVVSEVRGRKVLEATHVPYPTADPETGVPDPVRVVSLQWREALDGVLTSALARLPERGAAVA